MFILSWNVNLYLTKNGGNLISRTENIVRVLKKLNPDLLLIQEASKYFLSELSILNFKILSSELTHGGFCVILSKPHINAKEYMTFKLNGSSIILNDDIKIINCHLTPFFKNHNTRIKMFNQMMGKQTMIMGDTNMDNSQIVNCKLNDIALNEPFLKELKDTWYLSFFKNGSYITKRFDRIYTDLNVSNFIVHDKYYGLSDHVPISIKLNI